MDPKWTRVIAVVIVVIIVVAGVAIYYVRSHSSSGACGLKSTNPLIIDQSEKPDKLDPDVTFTTPGWALVQQVYQGMVNYNGSQSTNFSGILAKNWSESADHLHWNFTLRSGVHFSNGDPYNAYVQWYSLYRTLVMNQGPSFILSENFWFPNLTYYNPVDGSFNWNASVVNTLVSELNHWNFFTPSASEIAVMEESNQSFQVINDQTIELNLGQGYLGGPYTYLLAALSAPTSYAVDPQVIQNNSGVTANLTNTWMDANLLGTGQYDLQGSYSATGSGYVLVPDAHYWGKAAAATEPWNNLLQPANTTVQVNFQDSASLTVQDLSTGQVGEASFAYLGPSTINQLKGVSCLVVQADPTVYGSTSGAWWIYMNQTQKPFNNLSVREAVVHAINYPQIIQEAFGGYAQQWVGPVPPSYPYYNPGNLQPYQYNLTQAKAEIADSPCANNACAGSPITYEYVNLGDWEDVATILKSDLAQIGITINPAYVSLDQLVNVEQKVDPQTGQCTAQESSGGLGPFPMGQEFYTSDYISPDDWTQNDMLSYGSANQCMSGFNEFNASGYDTQILQAASESNPANLTADYANLTSIMYNNYTDAWLVVPTQFSIYNDQVHGQVLNPMASAEPFAIGFNTQYCT